MQSRPPSLDAGADALWSAAQFEPRWGGPWGIPVHEAFRPGRQRRRPADLDGRARARSSRHARPARGAGADPGPARRGLSGRHHHRRGRHRHRPPPGPGAPDHSRRPGRAHGPALPPMAAGQPRPRRPRRQRRRPDLHRQRPAAGVGSQHRPALGLSDRGPRRRQPGRGRLPVADPDRGQSGPRRRHARNAEHPVGESPALSGGLLLASDHLQADAETARWLELRRRPRHRQLRERPGDLRPHHPRPPGRQPRLRRPALPPDRPRSRRSLARPHERRGRHGQDAGGHRRTHPAPPQPGPAGRPPVRRPPLRPLRLPGGRDRQAGRHRPGAPALVREQRRSQILHRPRGHPGRPRPAGPRIHPQLERQVAPPRRPDDAQPQRAAAELPALGL
ncbi:hypothetical protein D3C72_1103420 [compost metagenome]